MLSFWTLALALFSFAQQVQSGYRINEFKYELFRPNQLASFRKFEYQNLDENFFSSDFTRAPRHYNTSKCLDDLEQILVNLENHDKQSMMCKIDYCTGKVEKNI